MDQQSPMTWERLLHPGRLGRAGAAGDPAWPSEVRTEFQRDYDRIIFSAAFRRLQGKTQVFPIPETDMTHTRLTHSLEASCVGRSLGTLVGQALAGQGAPPAELASILAAASLTHDIGNPPFGHSGEDAIAEYFARGRGQRFLQPLSQPRRMDFEWFEGNAMGFHVLTARKVAQTEVEGGFALTMATLGAFTKYPRPAHARARDTGRASERKSGLFVADLPTFEQVAAALGLPRSPDGAGWTRHPLAFLTEAADDICYTIVDLEDGYKLGLVSYDDAEGLLLSVVRQGDLPPRLDAMAGIRDPRERIGYLRAKAINNLVGQVARTFIRRSPEMLAGVYDRQLCGEIPAGETVRMIKDISFRQIYSSRRVVEVEAAGFEVLSGLLEAFLGAALERPGTARSAKTLSLVSPQYLDRGGRPFADHYQTLLSLTEYVSGMTDTFAIDTYRLLKGISLPNYAP